jgi:hypothetical protein
VERNCVLLEHFPDILERKATLMGRGKFLAFTLTYINFREKYPLTEFLDSEEKKSISCCS